MNNKDVILCIDDEQIILKLMKAQLVGHFGEQFDFMFVETAEEAEVIIKNLKDEKRRLVMTIVDQILPGKQGTEFLTELALTFPYAIKILFSGKSDFESVIAAINEAEIYRYMIKPWDEVDFINIVSRGIQQFYIKENIELQLGEIHHRVKNNLTIITCLLELQINEIDDAGSKSYFQQSINRINSIAKVHELIYESEDMTSVDIKKYLEKIIPTIHSTLQDYAKNIEFEFDIPSYKLKVNQAIPLGLIFNELITNSFKYAFNESNEGKIVITMGVEGNRLAFSYKDSGPGFESSGSLRNTNSLGLMLINIQLQQLESIYTLNTNNTFELNFSFDAGRAKRVDNALHHMKPQN
ncbi:MAG: response regulator [Balneolaceae bacterium]|nr:response regulator [Balneolaceae bacterium]